MKDDIYYRMWAVAKTASQSITYQKYFWFKGNLKVTT